MHQKFSLRKNKILIRKLTEDIVQNISDPLISNIVVPAFLFDDLLRNIFPRYSFRSLKKDNIISTFFGVVYFQDKLAKVFRDFQNFWKKGKYEKEDGNFSAKRLICTCFIERFPERAINALGMDLVLMPLETEKAAFFDLINKKTYFEELSNADEANKLIFKESQPKIRKISEAFLKFNEYCSIKSGEIEKLFIFNSEEKQQFMIEYLSYFEYEDTMKVLAVVIVRELKKAISIYGLDFQLDTIGEFLTESEELIKDVDISFVQENMEITKVIELILRMVI